MEPPYYAVIFSSMAAEDQDGYAQTAARMEELAAEQPGYLGIESARSGALGITVSYWQSEEAISRWKANAEHISRAKPAENGGTTATNSGSPRWSGPTAGPGSRFQGSC